MGKHGYLVVEDGVPTAAAWRSNRGGIGTLGPKTFASGDEINTAQEDTPDGIADGLDDGIYKIKVGKWRRGNYDVSVGDRLDDPAAEVERLAKLAGVKARSARTSRPGIAVAGTSGRYTYSDLAAASSNAASYAKMTTARLAEWLADVVAIGEA